MRTVKLTDRPTVDMFVPCDEDGVPFGDFRDVMVKHSCSPLYNADVFKRMFDLYIEAEVTVLFKGFELEENTGNIVNPELGLTAFVKKKDGPGYQNVFVEVGTVLRVGILLNDNGTINE